MRLRIGLGLATALAFGLALGTAGPAPPAAGGGAPAAADTACSEPSPCPAPSDSAAPEITCYEPTSTPPGESTAVHLYGKHLTDADGSVSHLSYRPLHPEVNAVQTDEDLEVHSACHLSGTLHPDGLGPWFSVDSLEFKLIRHAPTPEERQEGYKGIFSDWHRIELKK